MNWFLLLLPKDILSRNVVGNLRVKPLKLQLKVLEARFHQLVLVILLLSLPKDLF